MVHKLIYCCILRERDSLEILRKTYFNPLNAELNPICDFLALLGAHHILHVFKIRVKVEVSGNSTRI